MWFNNNQQKQLNKLKTELDNINIQNQINHYQSQINAQKDKSIYQPVRVQESLATNLLASNKLNKVFMGAVALWEIPAMIRNQFPYKQVLIQTLVQLDFVRWVGRVLYNDCPTFSTAIDAMWAQIGGNAGLTIKCFSKEQGQNEDLIKECDEYITKIDEANDLVSWEKEVFIRFHREGECFIQVQPSERSIDDDVPEIRCIEPDYIRPSVLKGQQQEDPNVSYMGSGEDWSFGIHNKPYKWYKPEAYNILWPPEYTKEEVIKAENMYHWANKEARNQKRGIPTSFKITEDMINVTLQREADAQSAIKRARITGILQYSTNIDQGYVQTDLHELGKTDRPHGDEYEIHSISTLGLNSSESDWLALIKGREFVPMPILDSASSEAFYKRSIASIAAYYGLPLATFGISNEQSFASSLIEETIPTRRRETEQGELCNYFKKIIKRCIEMMYGSNDLWDKIDIKVSGPSVVIRDEKVQTEAHVLKINSKLESRETAQTDLGLDPIEEDQKIEEDPIAAEMEEKQNEMTDGVPQSEAGKKAAMEGEKEKSTKN